MKITILADRFNYRQAIEEEKNNWLFGILNHLGIDIGGLDNLNSPEIVYLFLKSGIQIINYPGIDAVRVMNGQDSVGEWAGPEFILKADKNNGELYYEITVENWSILDEEISLDD